MKTRWQYIISERCDKLCPWGNIIFPVLLLLVILTVGEVSLKHRCLSTYPLPWAPCKFSITLECYLGNVAIWIFWSDLLLREVICSWENKSYLWRLSSASLPRRRSLLAQQLIRLGAVNAGCGIRHISKHSLCSVLLYTLLWFNLLFFKILMELLIPGLKAKT